MTKTRTQNIKKQKQTHSSQAKKHALIKAVSFSTHLCHSQNLALCFLKNFLREPMEARVVRAVNKQRHKRVKTNTL